MSKRKTIICPYCCRRYGEEEPFFDMWFRSERGPDVVDENLKLYYMDVERMSELDAGTAALKKRAVHIDWANYPPMEGDYDQNQYEEYGCVKELTYEGEQLWQRLCPNCHNELPLDAGFYDMKMIGLYGDTSVGKTVYLSVLEAILRRDPSLEISEKAGFQGRLEYLGSGQDKEEYQGNYDQLILGKTLYGGTRKKGRVQPQIFQFTYDRSMDEGATVTKKALLVFCDIPGENTRDLQKLRRSGFYLRSVDGILLLLDPTRLPGAQNYMQGTVNDPGKNVYQATEDSLNQLGHLLQERGSRISIPTAVVITKLDALRDYMRRRKEITDFWDVLFAPDANFIHEKYLNRQVIASMNEAVRSMISRLGGGNLIDAVASCFETTSYFAVSSLGKSPVREVQVSEPPQPAPGEAFSPRKSPVRETAEPDDRTLFAKKVRGALEPYRVTEPFYWLMAKFDCIPYYHQETWKYTRIGFGGKIKEEREEEIQFYYYESDCSRLEELLDEKLADRGIRRDDRRWIQIGAAEES